MEDLIRRLTDVKTAIHGCESLSVASSDGFILATTLSDARDGELLAARASRLLKSCAQELVPLKAGRCRTLDFRGDRQVLVTYLPEVEAFLICVLHPGAQPIGADERVIRDVIAAAPSVLRGEEVRPASRYYLQRDNEFLVPLRQGFLLGRGEQCDIVVSAETVEDEHLRFEILDDTVLVRDLDTREGTKVNKRPFTGTIELRPGDRLTLPQAGGFNLVVLDASGEVIGSRDGQSRRRSARRSGNKAEKAH